MDSSPIFQAIRKKVIDISIASATELSKFSIEVIPLSSVGFAGDTFRITFNGMLRSSDKYDKIYFVKRTPENERLREVFASNLRFRCEILAYTEVIPALVDIQNEIKSNDIVKISFPEFFGGSSVDHNEFILLECLADFATRPMVLYERNIYYREELKTIVEMMGNFHALSFVLKHRKPELFARHTSALKRCSITKDDYWRRGCEFAYDFTMKAMDREDHINVLQKLQGNQITLYEEAMQKSKYKIICHGDCHLWNFIFKLKEGDPKRIEDCKMLDLQLMQCTSPVVDLNNLLAPHCAPDNASFTDTVDLHYNTMARTLKHFELDIEDIYPRSEYDKDLRETAIVEITIAANCFVIASLAEDFPKDRNVLFDLFTGNLKEEDFLNGVQFEKKAASMREKFEDIFKRHRLL